MNQAEKIKMQLWDDIESMADHPELLAEHPDKDFTRSRKIKVKDVLSFPIVMERDTVDRELLKYFAFSTDVPSLSAYFQQRRKLKQDVFKKLFDLFNSHFEFSKYKDKYILLAADGSGFNLYHDSSDLLTFIPPNTSSPQGHNEMHITASYAITDRRFTDAVIQPSPQKNEYSAVCELVDRASFSSGIPLFLADRGFPSYNLFAHCKEKGSFFLVRAKDMYIERLLKDDMPSATGEFDITVERIIVRSAARKNRSRPESPELYRYVDPHTSFDFIAPGSPGEYFLTLRALRVRIADGVYENLVTNLPPDEFDLNELRILYYLRWGIETSFRELKHAVGAQDFHCRVFRYVVHEVWARFLLYNFCSLITALAVVKQPEGRKYDYQVNFTMAIKNCHDYIRQRPGSPQMDIIGLIEKYVLPIRPGRNFARQHKFQSPLKFTYRH